MSGRKIVWDCAAPPGRAKRGPVSRLEQQIEALAKLPRSKQRFVSNMIDAVLAQEQDA